MSMGREAGSCSPHCPGTSALGLPHALLVCGPLGQPPFLEAGAGRGTPTGLPLPLPLLGLWG